MFEKAFIENDFSISVDRNNRIYDCFITVPKDIRRKILVGWKEIDMAAAHFSIYANLLIEGLIEGHQLLDQEEKEKFFKFCQSNFWNAVVDFGELNNVLKSRSEWKSLGTKYLMDMLSYHHQKEFDVFMEKEFPQIRLHLEQFKLDLTNRKLSSVLTQREQEIMYCFHNRLMDNNIFFFAQHDGVAIPESKYIEAMELFVSVCQQFNLPQPTIDLSTVDLDLKPSTIPYVSTIEDGSEQQQNNINPKQLLREKLAKWTQKKINDWIEDNDDDE